MSTSCSAPPLRFSDYHILWWETQGKGGKNRGVMPSVLPSSLAGPLYKIMGVRCGCPRESGFPATGRKECYADGSRRRRRGRVHGERPVHGGEGERARSGGRRATRSRGL